MTPLQRTDVGRLINSPTFLALFGLFLGVIGLLALWFWPNFVAPDRAALGQRADSLTAIDPVREAGRAASRRDFRFLGTCGYACGVFGSAHDSIAASTEDAALAPDSIKIVEGTSDAILNPDMARLDSIAAVFANRYNLAMLHERLSRKNRD